MPVITMNLKRMKKEYDGTERWVKIGAVTVNTDTQEGSVYINHIDEIWKLFPKSRIKE